MVKKIYTKLYFLLISFSIVIIDQFTKYLIFNKYQTLLNKDFILFRLEFVKNYGAAFNLFSGNRVFLAIVSSIFSGVVFYLIIRKSHSNIVELYSYSFILGGTIGNGIDRIFTGYVIDYIDLNFINFPVFNIADISINIGFLLLIFFILKKI